MLYEVKAPLMLTAVLLPRSLKCWHCRHTQPEGRSGVSDLLTMWPDVLFTHSYTGEREPMGCGLNTSIVGVLLYTELAAHLTVWGLLSCVYFMCSCVYVWAYMYLGEHGRSEGNFLELGLPFHHSGLKPQLRFARGLYPLSHLDGPQFAKLWLVHTCETVPPSRCEDTHHPKCLVPALSLPSCLPSIPHQSSHWSASCQAACACLHFLDLYTNRISMCFVWGGSFHSTSLFWDSFFFFCSISVFYFTVIF